MPEVVSRHGIHRHLILLRITAPPQNQQWVEGVGSTICTRARFSTAAWYRVLHACDVLRRAIQVIIGARDRAGHLTIKHFYRTGITFVNQHYQTRQLYQCPASAGNHRRPSTNKQSWRQIR